MQKRSDDRLVARGIAAFPTSRQFRATVTTLAKVTPKPMVIIISNSVMVVSTLMSWSMCMVG